MELNKIDIRRFRQCAITGMYRDSVHWARANRNGLAEYLTAIAPWGNPNSDEKAGDCSCDDSYRSYCPICGM